MIWTSIEIIVIMIIMIIMLRRGKTNTLSPEIKQMIASMPTQPAPSSYRRNSLSGPATPLKSKSDLDPGPKLQRFCSEATLGMYDHCRTLGWAGGARHLSPVSRLWGGVCASPPHLPFICSNKTLIALNCCLSRTHLICSYKSRLQ